MPASASTSSS
ncbi:hypothetical protein HU200_061399 [Digitaria exilis]|uniref:Uncharacterized protein n=1 Tax=Digitaria exilis TaxID=1010633 RepID=A0A835A951_9POAL|nr:hypothetical protein HU200_061399 [Digitaria exilis]